LTVVLAERDAEDAAAFSDRIVLMKNGTVVKSGLPREVLRDPETLRSSGVAPPQLTELASLMNSRLHKSDLSFLNVDEAELAIVRDILNQRGVRRP
jgi:ABC-type proline/glycine betaine transport system ATPase subunit